MKKLEERKFRYLIASPRNGRGGTIVLHVLCKCLNELGHEASILYIDDINYRKGRRIKYWIRLKFWIRYIKFTIIDIYKKTKVKIFGKDRYLNNEKYSEYINEPVKGCHRRIWPFAKKDEIVVYPEIVWGNFTGAKNVVRWLLYFNHYQSGDYEESDLFFSYSDAFNDIKLNPSNRKLSISYFDLDTYKQYNYGKRNGKCYIVRKGKQRKDLPKEFDGIVVDDLPEEEKVKLFNSCEYCISYDLYTAYSSIAALCGCTSIVVPEENKTRADYIGNSAKYGVAYGFSAEEIQYAKETREKILELYMNRNASCIKNVENFVKECEDYFKK
jgi:hypothetical protein